MARLAEYMAGFAELLGHCGHVHLEQEGTLDGEVIQVGGRDETIEIHLTYT